MKGQCVALATASFSGRCGAASWARLLTPPLLHLVCTRHVLPASPAARVAIHFGHVTTADTSTSRDGDGGDYGRNITAVVGVSHTLGVTHSVVSAPSDGWRLLGWCAGPPAAMVYERRQLAQVRDAATGLVRHEVRHRGAMDGGTPAGQLVHVNGRWLVGDVGAGWAGRRDLVVWRLDGREVDLGMRLCFSAQVVPGMDAGQEVQCRWMKLMTDVVPGVGGVAHGNEVVALVFSYNSGERALVVADLEESWNACTTPTCFGPMMAVVIKSWRVPQLQPHNYPSQEVPIPGLDDYLIPIDLQRYTVSLFSVKSGSVVSEIPCAFHFTNSAVFDIGNCLFGVHTTKNKLSVFDGNRVDTSVPVNIITTLGDVYLSNSIGGAGVMCLFNDTSVPVNTTTLGDVYPSNLFGGGGVICLFNDNSNTATLVDPETSSILFSVSVVGGCQVRFHRFFSCC
ncbi:hypothetical protein Pelo_18708 [Pelomyxa schiedti]|nr:hypothetical protein Pelo_18708 [Pelomyxa schiedti]